MFLTGDLLLLPGSDVSDTPGNSPCFQCLFLATEEEEEEEEAEAEAVFEVVGAEIAKRVTLKMGSWDLGLLGFGVFLHLSCGIGEGTTEEENDRDMEAITIE